jgi:tetratricopeptide (TPR) repeat protein
VRHAALLESQGQADAALALYGSAIAASDDPQLYLQAGKLRYQLGQHTRALANFQAALERSPGLAAAYQGIGLAQRRLGAIDAAVVAFKHYLQLAPAAPDRVELEQWLQKHAG